MSETLIPLTPVAEWTPAEIADHLTTVWITHHVDDNGFPSASEQMHYDTFLNSGLPMIKYVESVIQAKLQAAEARANEAESALAEAIPIHNAMTERAISAEARAEKAERVVKAAIFWADSFCLAASHAATEDLIAAVQAYKGEES